jgi:cysteine desulfurase
MPGYLDNAATTPLRPEVLEAMLPFLTEHYANPSGAHVEARRARRAIDDARDQVAAAVGAEPGEVVFTSGGTEADNLAVLGVHGAAGGTVVCSAAEHHAVLDAVRQVGGRVVPVTPTGAIDLDALAEALDDEVTLVSVMLVNNEIGTISPLAEVASLVRDRAPHAVVHTDAVQALCWLDVAAIANLVDLVSLSAHKLGGPKGVGALIVGTGTSIAPRQVGGGQERALRSGTQNVPGIVGFGAAIEVTVAQRAAHVPRCREWRDLLLDGLLARVEGAVETAGPDRSERVAGIAHVCLPGVESEALLYLLEEHNVLASAASSCSSGAAEPSHVLAAMGIPAELAAGSLRLSLGWASTLEDVELALDVVPAAVERLRLFA